MKISPISYNYNIAYTKKSNPVQNQQFKERNYNSIPFGAYNLNILNSPSFGSKEIYSFTREGVDKKYASCTEAAEDLMVRNTRISHALSNDLSQRRTVLGIVLIQKSDMLTKDENGKEVLDLYKGARLAIEKFKGAHNQPVYIFAHEGKLLKSFGSYSEICRKYKISQGSASYHFEDGKRKWYDEGYIYKWEEVVSANEDGTIGIDFKKVKSLIEKENEASITKPFYVVDADGTCKKYYTKKKAQTKYKISRSSINFCLKNSTKSANGNYIIPAAEIEVEVGDKIVVDKAKLKKAIQLRDNLYTGTSYDYSDYLKNPDSLAALFYVESKPIKDENFSMDDVDKTVLTLDENHKLIKYPSLNSMIEKNNLNRQNLWMAFKKGKRSLGGLYIFRAKEIQDENGKTDVKKVAKLIKENNAHTIDSAIYVFEDENDKKGTRCEDPREVARVINSSRQTVYYSLLKGLNTVKGHPIVKANLVEEIDQEGLCSINKEKWENYLNNRSIGS